MLEIMIYQVIYLDLAMLITVFSESWIQNIETFFELFDGLQFPKILYNNYLITFGGYGLLDIYIFNIKTNKWYISDIKLSNKLMDSSSVIVGDNIHVIGGQNWTSNATYYSINISHLLNCKKKELTNQQTTS